MTPTLTICNGKPFQRYPSLSLKYSLYNYRLLTKKVKSKIFHLREFQILLQNNNYLRIHKNDLVFIYPKYTQQWSR